MEKVRECARLEPELAAHCVAVAFSHWRRDSVIGGETRDPRESANPRHLAAVAAAIQLTNQDRQFEARCLAPHTVGISNSRGLNPPPLEPTQLLGAGLHRLENRNSVRAGHPGRIILERDSESRLPTARIAKRSIRGFQHDGQGPVKILSRSSAALTTMKRVSKMTAERICKNSVQNRLDLRDLYAGICCADFAAFGHRRLRTRCETCRRRSDPVNTETVPAGAMVRARRFFLCTTNSSVLCLPFTRNPINYVPTVLTTHGQSVAAD